MHDLPKPAPPEEMVRYLAAFRRAFSAIAAYAAKRDRAGLLLGGHLADALHNVPSMLWHCDEAEWHNPRDMRAWLEHEFFDRLRSLSAPPALIGVAENILSAAGAADVLGLPGGAPQVQLPPVDRLRQCLVRLYDACLEIRRLRHLGSNRRVGEHRTPWVDINEESLVITDHQIAYYGELARTLGPLASAIVRWPSFDPEAYEREALARCELLPADSQASWARAVAI